MNVKLVSSSQSIDGYSPEDLVVYMARVSSPNNQTNFKTKERLIRYMIKHNHWSPFEMINMCVEIETSKAVAIQILRHKSMSHQELSQRYTEVETYEPIELRVQSESNRQSSVDIFEYPDALFDDRIKEAMETIFDLYDDMIQSGVARECARMILPMATKTKLYMNGNARSFIHYIQERTKETTQKEHRLVAEKIKEIFVELYPTIAAAAFTEE